MNSFDPPTEHLQLIVNLFNNGKLEQALTESKTLLEKFPNSVFLHNIAGASNTGLKQFDNAIKSYKKAIKINPDFAEAYYNMAIAQKVIGEFDEAIKSYKKALKIKPNYFEAHYNLGNILSEKGDKKAAIDSYEFALQIKPGSAMVYNNMGNILKDSNGDFKEALDSYKKALEIEPEYFEAQQNLIALMTCFIPQEDDTNRILKVNKKIREIKVNDIISKTISDDEVINLFSESERYLNNFDLQLKTKEDQVFRGNSMNCERHLSIFDEHKVIPEYCFGCFKVQVEPRSIIELIKLFIIFDQLELSENNNRKCMIELRPEIPGFYKGLIYCSDLDQANQISKHLNKILKYNIGPHINSSVKRGCSQYGISYPDYKEINQSGSQLMNYDQDWKEIEISYDRNNTINEHKFKKVNLSGLSISDVLIIRKWIDYAKGIGDPSADLLNQNKVNYQMIHDRAKARLELFQFGKN